MQDPHPIEQVALSWLVRLGNPAFDDWDGLTAWLEAAPEHARIFNALRARELALVDALAAEPVLLAPRAANDNRRWRVRAAAAALLLLVATALGVRLLAPLWHGDARVHPVRIATRAGEFRTVALGPGRSATLNGNSALSVAANGEATLLAGEAWFDVAHDPHRPFLLRTGSVEIIDLGTRFDVARRGTALRIAVAEGAVSVVLGNGRKFTVEAGHAVELDRGVLNGSDIAADRVGSWRTGRLYFDNAPVAQMLADIEQATGIHLDVPPETARARFTGTIILTGDRPALRRQLEAMLGVAPPGTE